MAESNRARRRVIVTGYVQGVGFRFSAQRRAQSLGLNGWIRNVPGGAVEAVVEGAPEAVRSFVEWAHSGPSGAAVENVEITAESPSGELGFRILS